MSDTQSSATALVNGRIVLPDRVVTGLALLIEGGRITGLSPAADLRPDVERVDVAGNLVTPGLIDIHTHGALRHTFNEPDANAWTVITRENLRRGTTSLLATFAPTPNLEQELAFCRKWMHRKPGRRRGARRCAGARRVPGKPVRQPCSKGCAGSLLRPLCRRRVGGSLVGVFGRPAGLHAGARTARRPRPRPPDRCGRHRACGRPHDGPGHDHTLGNGTRAAPCNAPVERHVDGGARGAVAQAGRAGVRADFRRPDRRNHRGQPAPAGHADAAGLQVPRPRPALRRLRRAGRGRTARRQHLHHGGPHLRRAGRCRHGARSLQLRRQRYAAAPDAARPDGGRRHPARRSRAHDDPDPGPDCRRGHGIRLSGTGQGGRPGDLRRCL